MSTFVPSTIRCRCGEEYSVEVANGLHISLRPDIRQAIFDGTFHKFACPRCGMTTLVDRLLSFTDFPRRQWFTIAPSNGLPWRRKWLAVANESFVATAVNNAPPIVVQWGTEMTRRLMFGLAALREKLVIGDAGLDDRVIELLKIQLIRDLRDTFSVDHYFHLVAVHGDELVFERTHRDGIIRSFAIPRALYDDLAASAELPQLIATAFPDGLLIDHRAMLAPDVIDEPPPAST
jgi:hypothetical protein